MIDTFQERKAARKAYYEKFVKGWKQRPCVACNGSGRYDLTTHRLAARATALAVSDTNPQTKAISGHELAD